MGMPVVTVAAGGAPVTEVANGFGMPVTEALNGFGRAVTKVSNGFGRPVTYVADGGAAAVDWTTYWKLGGTTNPSIVLDFENNRYYDGSSNSASLASMVQNAGTVDANGLNFTGANNVNCIGAFLAALQAAAVTVGVSVKGAANGIAQGILAFGSGNPDAPILLDDSAGGYFNAWNGVGLTTSYLDAAQINSSTGPVNCASAWQAGARKIVWNNTGAVVSAGSGYAAVTSAKLGNYGANALPFTGKLRNIVVYPSYVSDTLLKGLSWRGPWRVTPYGIGGKGLKVATADRLSAGVHFNTWDKSQPWTITAAFYVNTSSLNAGSVNMICSNFGPASPYTGFRAYISATDKKVYAELASAWSGSGTVGLARAHGSSIVCDAHNIVHVTYDGSGSAAGIKVYLNGVADTMTVDADNASGSIANAQKFCVYSQTDATDTHGTASINDLAMTFILDSVVRSAGYVSQYGSPAGFMGIAPAPDVNTQLYYDFRELSGTTTVDRSANGYNGTATAVTWVTSFW